MVLKASTKALRGQVWQGYTSLLPTFPEQSCPCPCHYKGRSEISLCLLEERETGLVWFSTAVIKTINKSSLGDEEFISYYNSVHVEGKSGQELKGGTWRQKRKQRFQGLVCLPACSSWLL